VKACCGVAREAEALTIALTLLQRGLFRLTGTGGLELEVGEVRQTTLLQLRRPTDGDSFVPIVVVICVDSLQPPLWKNPAGACRSRAKVHLTTVSESLLSVTQNAGLEARRPWVLGDPMEPA